MSYELWSQTNFTKGELSPFMYSRNDVDVYYNGMKQAQNVLTYPTGAAGKRFGTYFKTFLSQVTDPTQTYFATFQYFNECIYQFVFTNTALNIYLEGLLVATVVTTIDGPTCGQLSSTVIGNIFRVAAQTITPFDITRSSNSGNVITAASSNTLTLTSAVTAGLVYPVQFTNSGGALPTTSPQVRAGVTYFIKTLTTTTAALYGSSFDAFWGLEPFTITNNGSGTNTLFILNTWAIAATAFKNLPVYDFNGAATSYDALTVTPGATSGNAVTITVSSAYAPLTSAYVGGAFIGGGGVSRITAVASTTSFTVAVLVPFDNTNAIAGSLVFLAEPAWSNARGWPIKCSSYQNRAIFANSASLPNGFWASSINDYYDFDDLEGADDNAISWYPSSDDVNYINFIVPYRSITVHTNSGIYSSPLSDVAAITPSNFSLQLQDSTPATILQPRAIDNQIIVVSGNDAHTMLWDGINNAYTTDIISVVSEHLIKTPVDEDVFADLNRAGSRYVFIINENGTMAVYQTLIAQSVGGFTPHILEHFRQVASTPSGRCWFLNERWIAIAGSPITITAFTSSTLTATASNLSTTTPTAITFTTTGSLPASTPAINTTQYFWAIGVTADTFMVYGSQEDALANQNAYVFTTAGTNSHVTGWPPTQKFTMEELTQDYNLDCMVYYNGSPSSLITTGTLFNAQDVKMVGDGFGFDGEGFNNQVQFNAHGIATTVSTAYIGFPINLLIEPMPLSMTTGYSQKNTALTKPKHIRTVRFMFNNTIGGTINGVPIALSPFDQAGIGEPPIPARGIFEMGLMKGWDDFNQPSFQIQHDEPFDIQLLGVYYSVEV